ncbi:hypothetical protein CRENPOLYSF2_370029 [Crenothrix polyspora]|jgi:hypothetical protein|uniref:Uncharacterized protein n=1 Tax=Crenothrix polyspora TaxID=360316 RepID=A0A1R4HCE2_9GAMM|nr:hypothetical protein [Crenothrix polyspora]SJM93918.1 hypothetical protein CRENPOLYSF2_370029 [Crenothrix polyspora]
MSNLQPTLSESIQGLIMMAIIGISIAVYFGISDDSSTEVESLKAQIVAKDKQLSKSRAMNYEVLSENMALSMDEKEPQDVRDHAVLILITHYDRIIDCVGGGSCELVSENDRKI